MRSTRVICQRFAGSGSALRVVLGANEVAAIHFHEQLERLLAA